MLDLGSREGLLNRVRKLESLRKDVDGDSHTPDKVSISFSRVMIVDAHVSTH